MCYLLLVIAWGFFILYVVGAVATYLEDIENGQRRFNSRELHAGVSAILWPALMLWDAVSAWAKR